MTARPFVLVHGAWHGGWAWDGVAAPLRRAGHGVLAVDLPGAGPHAIPPDADPQDPDAFAAAPSAAVHITQAARTDALVAALKTQARPAILVAHSFGGVTVTAAAEALADRVAAVVYVAALMLPPGRTAHQAASRPAFARSGVPGLRVADPSRLGASRLNPWSRDTDYRARVCSTLYGGVPARKVDAALARLHADEPAAPAHEPSPASPARYGRLPRHFIITRHDRAIPPEAQADMVHEMDAALGGKTRVNDMQTGHAPMLEDPAGLARVLLSVAADL